MFARQRLRHRLALALLGLALLSTLLLGTVAVYRLDWELYEQLVQLGQTVARYLADEAFYRAYIQGQKDLALLARSALGDDIKFVEIVKDGEVLGRAGEMPTGRALEVWQAILDTRLRAIRRLPGDTLSAPQPPFQTNSYVRLGVSLDYLAYEQRRELLWIGMAGLGIGLIALIAAWMLSGVIIRPLERVTEAMKRFGQGELAVRAPVERHDELGELAQTFNQMAEAIVKMRRELEQASRAKSEFITLMGHELRTPLGVLQGYLELLLEGVSDPLTDEQRSYLQSALRASEHLQALLTNVLHYAKLELGVERLHPEDVDVAQLARETAEALQHLAREKLLHIELDLEPATICAHVDRTKLRQILINLLQNAIRHTPAGGRIWVGVRGENADGVRLWVRDSGPGIPAEDQQKIFEPFVRLDDRSSEESAKAKEGLGLGLAVVKRYAELHGGRAWVESTPGRGSTFYVLLPHRPCSSPKPALIGGGDKNDDNLDH